MATKTKKNATKKTTKPAAKKADGKMSQVDAALKVLAEARKPMNTAFGAVGLYIAARHPIMTR